MWAASNFIPGKAFEKVAEAIRALDAALQTGVGVTDAFKALKALDVDPATLADVQRTVNAYEDLRTACTVNSFPGDTQVLMADGIRKAISEVRRTDQVLAADPATGDLLPEPVISTFSHDTDRLVDITLFGGGQVSSTAGHRFYVVERGWTMVSDLRAGDSLRADDGTIRTVTALHDRRGLTDQRVHDLTVDDLHTFYVLAGRTPVLVHNCSDLVADAQKFPGQAHILDEHVNPTQAEALALAVRKGEKNSVFVDFQTAQQVVDYALANKAGEITRWLRGNEQQKTLRGTWVSSTRTGR
ncbi:polymorphic toxin-type HINT domain-containing protein [Streptomyces bluensis]|uniref:polymorphic toxin-type HINT domain-containing protein n=1 Tax=Streptomyces bluensis TaxID=33897 RepID=UPI0036C0391A